MCSAWVRNSPRPGRHSGCAPVRVPVLRSAASRCRTPAAAGCNEATLVFVAGNGGGRCPAVPIRRVRWLARLALCPLHGPRRRDSSASSAVSALGLGGPPPARRFPVRYLGLNDSSGWSSSVPVSVLIPLPSARFLSDLVTENARAWAAVFFLPQRPRGHRERVCVVWLSAPLLLGDLCPRSFAPPGSLPGPVHLTAPRCSVLCTDSSPPRARCPRRRPVSSRFGARPSFAQLATTVPTTSSNHPMVAPFVSYQADPRLFIVLLALGLSSLRYLLPA